MTGDRWTILGGIGVYLALRLIDYLLPNGRHFSWADRWHKDNDQKEGDCDHKP